MRHAFQPAYVGGKRASYDLTPGCLLYAPSGDGFDETLRMPHVLYEQEVDSSIDVDRKIEDRPVESLLWGPFSEQQTKKGLWLVKGQFGPSSMDLNLYQAGKQRKLILAYGAQKLLRSQQFWDALIGESCLHVTFHNSPVMNFELAAILTQDQFLVAY